MIRTVFPSWFQAQAATLDWAAAVRTWPAAALKGNLDSLAKAPSRQSFQLRWMLSPQFGLPRSPFRVFFLNAQIALTPHPELSGEISGFRIVPMVKPAARIVLRVVLTSTGAAAFGFSNDGKIVSFASTTGTGSQVLAMDASAISYVTISGTGNLVSVWSIGAEELANNANWKEIEHVGLPLSNAASMSGTGYDTSPQGMVAGPVDANKAALRRLASGAPLVGWVPVLPSGGAAPAWAPAQPQPFLNDQQVTLLPRLASMMQQSGAPWKDKDIMLSAPITAQAPGGKTSTQASQATYSPLSLLLMASSSDPFSALGLGFGTAYTLAELTQLIPVAAPPPPPLQFIAMTVQPFVLFTGAMVTCDVSLDLKLPGLPPIPLTLASIVLSNGQIEVVPPATGLAASISGSYPPQHMDDPWQESVRLAWARPQPILPIQSNPASYAVIRALPGGSAPLLMNKPRPGGGVLPYIPALAPDNAPDAPVAFDDTQAPTTVPNANLTYSVVAQDWFGVWSAWTSASVTLPGEPTQAPVLSDAKWTLAPGTNPFAATLSVQVAWDWTTRSPKQIDVFASLLRPADNFTPLPKGAAPGGVQKSIGGSAGTPVSITFNAAQQAQITAANATVSLVPTPSYNASGHDMRVYLITMKGFTLDFAGGNEIVAQLWAKGESNKNPAFTGTPEPLNATVLSPVPPPTPQLPQIVWSTLPDPAGISRVHLTWPKSAGAAGYIVYEATETRMIAVAEDAGWVPPPPAAGQPVAPVPDLTAPFAGRLGTLRSLDWGRMRKAFTRINSTATQAVEMEVSLPRGSKVIHAFVVTAVSANNVESAFPPTSAGFAAVATPFVQTCQAPRIAATVDAASGVVTLMLEQRGRVTPARYDILFTKRDDLATDPGLMGKPLTLNGVTTVVPGPTPGSDPASVTTVYKHVGVAPSWSRVWYRAVGVTVDNLTNPAPAGTAPPWGALGGRSRPTEAVSVVLPPLTAPAAPTITQQGLSVSGNVLLLIHTPVAATATTLGSHVLKLVQNNGSAAVPGSNDPQPLYLPLESAAYMATMPLAGPAGQVFRTVQAGQTVIGIRLKTTATTTVTVTLTDPLSRPSPPVYLALQ